MFVNFVKIGLGKDILLFRAYMNFHFNLSTFVSDLAKILQRTALIMLFNIYGFRQNLGREGLLSSYV